MGGRGLGAPAKVFVFALALVDPAILRSISQLVKFGDREQIIFSELVRKRLEVYHDQTEPLIDYYKSWLSSGEVGAPEYVRIEGVGKVEEIRDQVFAALDSLG